MSYDCHWQGFRDSSMSHRLLLLEIRWRIFLKVRIILCRFLYNESLPRRNHSSISNCHDIRSGMVILNDLSNLYSGAIESYGIFNSGDIFIISFQILACPKFSFIKRLEWWNRSAVERSFDSMKRCSGSTLSKTSKFTWIVEYRRIKNQVLSFLSRFLWVTH